MYSKGAMLLLSQQRKGYNREIKNSVKIQTTQSHMADWTIGENPDGRPYRRNGNLLKRKKGSTN